MHSFLLQSLGSNASQQHKRISFLLIMSSKALSIVAAIFMAALCHGEAFFVADNHGILPHQVVADFLNSPAKLIGSTHSNGPSPLIITVGPPTSGKTTWLRKMREQTPRGAEPLLDISLDDQPNVYVRIPWALFCLKAPP